MAGGKNPELTVCQLHTALAALVRSWWLSSAPATERLLAKAATKITWAQRRNAQARKSHAKRTRRKLRDLGIKLTELKRCRWDAT
jgi:hypothetical protein